METMATVVRSSKSIDVRDNIKTVCRAINKLKTSGNVDEAKKFLETVDFESPLEKLVAVKLINAFKLNDSLMAAVSTEDLFLISQSLKCDWFFEDEAGLLSDRDLTVKFLSELSYSGRCKVIKKYAKKLKDSGKAENMYLWLEDIYGTSTALELLSACSEPFITDLLYSKYIVFPDRIVAQLYRKYPDLVVDFIFYWYEKKTNAKNMHENVSECYQSTLVKMASEKTDIFIEFYNKYNSFAHLRRFGRSLTHKILKAGYSSFLRDTDNYLKILHIKLVVSYLTAAQIQEMYFCLLPKSVSVFNESYSNYYRKDAHLQMLDHVKPPFAKELLVKNFKKKYGKDPSECQLSENYIKLFPSDIRTKWARTALADKDLNDNRKAQIYSLMPFDESFKLLKSLVPSALDAENRIFIVKCMMDSAKLSGNSGAVSAVVSYVVERLRNDSIQVRGKPLEEMKAVKLEELTAEQWAPIMELLNIIILNDEINCYTNELFHIYNKRICSKLNSGLPVDSEMEFILKYMNYYYNFCMAKDTKYRGVCLNWFNENLDKKRFANDSEKLNFAARLFCAINDYNSSCPHSPVRHKDWILTAAKTKMGECYSRNDIINSLKKNKALKHDLYDAIFPEAIFPEILLYKLSRCPSDISNNARVILDKLLDQGYLYPYKQFFNRLLLYTDVASKFNLLCLKEMDCDDGSDEEGGGVRRKEKCIFILSLLADARVFLSLIESFYPTGPKAECEGAEAQYKYRLQTAIASSLKNLNPPYRSLIPVKKFSTGDYLKLVLGSVLSVLLKISQTRALEFMKENMQTPISFRKHIIRVFKLVASKNAVSDLLLSALQDEKNVSLRLILLNSIFDTIKFEKSGLSWHTVKRSFSLVTDGDIKKMADRLYTSKDIPVEYLAEYIETVWATLTRLDMSDNTKANIFSLIDETSIRLISNDFADLLLGLTYPQAEKSLPSGDYDSNLEIWNSYISLYLNHCISELFEKRWDNVMQVIRKTFVKLVGKSLDSLKTLSHLVDSICRNSLDGSVVCPPENLLKSINAGLLNVFPEQEISNILFSVALYRNFIKNNKWKNVNGFADDTCSLVDLYCSTYGSHVVHVLATYVSNFVSANFHSTTEDCSLAFAHRLVTGPTSPLNKIVGVVSLPEPQQFRTDNENKMYKAVIDTITSSPDNSLKFYARHRLYNL